MTRRRRSSAGLLITVAVVGWVATAAVLAVLVGLLGGFSAQSGCGASPAGGGAADGAGAAADGAGAATANADVELGPPGTGVTVGASEYSGPGDPSSGTIGSSGANLASEPDSFAELGGTTFATATAMGGLPYGTPLRITWPAGHRSAIAYKRDIGLGGGPVDGHPRVIDLWWQLAGSLGIPYEHGEWSGAVRIERPPATGAGVVLGQVPEAGAGGAAVDGSSGAAEGAGAAGGAGEAEGAGAGGGAGEAGGIGEAGTAGAAACVPEASGGTGVPLTQGPRATLLPDGRASAPAGAPAAVKGMIAAGNQIVGRPYVYGGGHGLPLSELSPVYDCSSSVSHVLWGGGLLPATGDMTSGAYESWGLPGPGRWVTIYASPDHVFMYVAGLRWDTHNAAGAQDGAAGIGWHPLVREASGFVVRHPLGL